MGYAILRHAAFGSKAVGKNEAAQHVEDESAAATKQQAGMGARSIGLIGSWCLVTNNIIGPGMFQLSGLYQTAGWLPTTVCILLAALWTTQAALYLSKTMQSFGGNRDFSQRLEFNKIAQRILPRWAYFGAVAVLCTVFFFQNLANILMTSQVMDETILAAGHKACALDLLTFRPICVTADDDAIVTDSLFGDSYVVSVGYFVVMIVCIPLGILNLEDNISIQVGGMFLTLVCVLVWVVNFIFIGLTPSLVPMVGSGWSNFSPLLSTVLFNYGFVATVPSWLNEKAPHVATSSTIAWANVAATVQYLLVAVFGALSIPGTSSTDLISIINEGNLPGIWPVSQIMTYIFPIANILTSIPVFSIIIRYNLLQLKGVKFPVWLANFVSVILPWILVLPFFPGNTLNNLITWSSALLFVLLNLILPLWMYLAVTWRQEAGFPPPSCADDESPDEDAAAAAEELAAAAEGDDGWGVSKSLLGDVQADVEAGAAAALAASAAAAQEDAEDVVPLMCFSRLFGDLHKTEREYARVLFVVSVLVAFAALAMQVVQ